jgi:mannitol/fructose-specific phosphotransferase system IIA component (Ntr-type)
MNIPDFLAPSDVMINVAAADKQKLLQVLARKASVVGVVPDRLLAELRKREETALRKAYDTMDMYRALVADSR